VIFSRTFFSSTMSPSQKMIRSAWGRGDSWPMISKRSIIKAILEYRRRSPVDMIPQKLADVLAADDEA
jgi:hypothetical protein